MPTIWNRNQLVAQTQLWKIAESMDLICFGRWSFSSQTDWHSAKPSVLPRRRSRYIFSHFRRFLKACFLTKPHNLSGLSWIWNTFAFQLKTVYRTQKTSDSQPVKIFVSHIELKEDLWLESKDSNGAFFAFVTLTNCQSRCQVPPPVILNSYQLFP